jgi:two-component system, NarL family, response regulator NreC
VVRVVLADDHHLVRQGIRALLERASDIEVVGEAKNGVEAERLVTRLHPDVLVTDLAMPDLSGTRVAEHIRAQRLPTGVVVLSMYSSAIHVRQALLSGARGFVAKDSVADELLLAVRAVSQGGTFLSPSLSGDVLQDILTAPPVGEASTAVELITPREREVLQLIVGGETNKGIARTLQISVKTVERHRANLMSALGTHSVAELVQAAVKHGLVFIDT